MHEWIFPLMGFSKCEYQTVLTSYVYRNVHHLVSWIKIDQLDVTRFIISPFTAQHVSNVSTSVFRSLRLTVDIFHVLYFSVRIDVLASLLSKDSNANTSILTEKYNTWNISTISRKLLKMDVLTFETCWVANGEIIKRVTSSWSNFIQLSLRHIRRNVWNWKCNLIHS